MRRTSRTHTNRYDISSADRLGCFAGRPA